jgi:hypothetical protein
MEIVLYTLLGLSGAYVIHLLFSEFKKLEKSVQYNTDWKLYYRLRTSALRRIRYDLTNEVDRLFNENLELKRKLTLAKKSKKKGAKK